MTLPLPPDQPVLSDGFAFASFLSHWFKEHFSRMQSRACSCYAEAMVFFGRSPKNAVLFGKEGGIRAPWLSGRPPVIVPHEVQAPCVYAISALTELRMSLCYLRDQ